MSVFSQITTDKNEFYLDSYRHSAHLCEKKDCPFNSDVHFTFLNLSGDRIESVFMSMTKYEAIESIQTKIQLLQIGLNLQKIKYELLNVEFLNRSKTEQFITLKTI